MTLSLGHRLVLLPSLARRRTWQQLHDHLRADVRRAAGRDPQPSAAILDSQSVRTVERGGLERGFDCGKLIKGRKRHLLVDTLGLMHGLVVHSGGVQGRAGGPLLLEQCRGPTAPPQVLLKWRWIVERTIGWLNLARPLIKDYVFLPASNQAFIRLTMISIMLARLAQQA